MQKEDPPDGSDKKHITFKANFKAHATAPKRTRTPSNVRQNVSKRSKGAVEADISRSVFFGTDVLWSTFEGLSDSD